MTSRSSSCRRFLAELLVCGFHVPPWTSSLVTIASQRSANFYVDQLGT